MNIDPQHLGVLPILAGVVKNQETGELRWPVIVGGIITAGTIGVGSWLVGLSGDIRSLSAKMDVVMQRQMIIESRIDPFTLQCYTQDQAAKDRVSIDKAFESVYQRLTTLERGKK